jgi:rRNA-processing protein FCF1
MGLFMRKASVILDTNILLLIGSQGIDVFTEIDALMTVPYECCVVENTYRELEHIIAGKTKASGKDKFNAKLALIMAKQKGLKTLSCSQQEPLVDDTIVRLANEKTFVATLDKALQTRLKAKKAKIITVRQHRLVLTE